jgi:hypothetical protein
MESPGILGFVRIPHLYLLSRDTLSILREGDFSYPLLETGERRISAG